MGGLGVQAGRRLRSELTTRRTRSRSTNRRACRHAFRCSQWASSSSTTACTTCASTSRCPTRPSPSLRPRAPRSCASDAGFRRVPLARIASTPGHVTLLPTWLPAGYVQRWTAVAARSTTANGATEGRDVVALQYVRGFDALTVTTRTVADPHAAATIDPVEPDTSWADIVSRDVRLTAGAFAGVTARVVVASVHHHPPPLRGQERRPADGGRRRDGQGADRDRRVASAPADRIEIGGRHEHPLGQMPSRAVGGLGHRRAGAADGERDGMWRLGGHPDERRIDTAGVPVGRRRAPAPRRH